MNRQQQIAAFKRIAKRNYNKSMGWSTFVECFDDADIDQHFAATNGEDTETLIEAGMADIASVWDDRHAEADHDCAPCGDCGEGICDYCNRRDYDYA